MKKSILIAVAVLFAVSAAVNGQENKLQSEKVVAQGTSFDRQIKEIYTKIQKIVVDNKLINERKIKALPYQTEIAFGPDKNNPQYIEIKKHFYIKDSLFSGNYVGLEEKVLRIYVSGNSISKFESIVRSKNYKNLQTEEVVVTDPSPLTENTDDIVFSHTLNGRKMLENKKLSEVKNTVADPLRNNIKIQFIIPNLTVLNNALLFIVEANYKSFKDNDRSMTDFLKKSTRY